MKILMASETFRDKDHALHMATTLAGRLDANLVDETGLG